jgi:acyl carrier protein
MCMTAPTRARLRADQAFEIVRTAVAVVCECPESQVRSSSALADLGADSLGRVAMAEMIEHDVAAWLPNLHIGDTELGAFETAADVVDYLMARM